MLAPPKWTNRSEEETVTDGGVRLNNTCEDVTLRASWRNNPRTSPWHLLSLEFSPRRTALKPPKQSDRLNTVATNDHLFTRSPQSADFDAPYLKFESFFSTSVPLPALPALTGIAQPPLQYYLRVIASQPWSDVAIITFALDSEELNPTFAVLEMMQLSGALGPNVAMHKVWPSLKSLLL